MSSDINGFEVQEWNIHGFELKGKTTGKVDSTCPFCSHTRTKKKDKCARVFLDTGWFECYHCGENGQVHSYKRQNQTKEYVKPPQQDFVYEYSEALLKWFQEERHISEATLKRLKITEGPEWMPQPKGVRRCIKFNYFIGKELINIKFRDREKNFKLVSGAEKIMYNLNAIFNEKEALIVEGELDVAAYAEAGVYNVTSVPNGFNLKGELNLDYLTNCYEYFENKEKIYLAVDNDEAGQKGQRELVRRFGAEKIWLVDFKDCKDANDYLVKYGKLKLQETVANAKQFPLENIITIDDEWEALENFWEHGAPRGMTMGLKHQDEAISFDWKQYTLLLSAPGAGKSEKIDDMLARLIFKHDVKVAFCSVENQPYWIHYNKIFKKIYGSTPKKEDIKSEDVLNIKGFVSDNFCHVNFEKRYYLQDVLAKFEELVKRKGVRFFVLDPFNKITLKGVSKADINNYTAEYHMLIDEFVKKNDCHLLLVLHPTKLTTKEGSDKTYIMPTAYHAKGGGEHFDMSYNIIGMVRDYERNLIHFRTLKVKFQHLGTSGIDWFEAWNINNGRFTQIEDGYDARCTHQPEIFWHNGNWMNSKPWEKFEKEKINEEDLPDKEELPSMNPNDAFDAPVNYISDKEFMEDDEDEIPF